MSDVHVKIVVRETDFKLW